MVARFEEDGSEGEWEIIPAPSLLALPSRPRQRRRLPVRRNVNKVHEEGRRELTRFGKGRDFLPV